MWCNCLHFDSTSGKALCKFCCNLCSNGAPTSPISVSIRKESVDEQSNAQLTSRLSTDGDKAVPVLPCCKARLCKCPRYFNQKANDTSLSDNEVTNKNNFDNESYINYTPPAESKKCSNNDLNNVVPGSRNSSNDGLVDFNETTKNSNDDRVGVDGNGTAEGSNNNKEGPKMLDAKSPTPDTNKDIKKPENNNLGVFDDNAPDGTEDWGPMPFRKSTAR